MPLPSLALVLPALLLGLLFGSFLNVCIARLPEGESVVAPRSRCPMCRRPIRWYDNVPLLSWLLLRGRCRDCQARISIRYPLVELAVGLWFALAAYRLAPLFAVAGPAPLPFTTIASAVIATVAFALLGWLLLGLMVIDWRTQTLPDALTLGGLAAAIFLVCTQAIFLGPGEDQVMLSQHHIRLSSPGNVVEHGNLFLTGPEALIFGRITAVCGAALVLLVISSVYKAVRGRQGLGFGDVKLLAMVAAFLGFSPALLTLFLGVIGGGVYSVWLLARKRADGLSRIPLGSFLAAAGLVVAVFGQGLLGWYKALL